MRVLLDESLPRKLKNYLTDFDTLTVRDVRLTGLKNGLLLKAVAELADVFVTADRNVEYQQRLDRFKLAVIVLESRRTDLDSLLPLVPGLQEAIRACKTQKVQYVRR